MATPQEKQARALDSLRALQERGIVAIKSSDLTRTHRQLLLKSGFLQPVMKGWYIPARPDGDSGESAAWYASFWDFCATYLNDRFGTEWSLTAEQSLSIHVGNRVIPTQLLVRSPRGKNNVTHLPFDTSLLDVTAALPIEGQRIELDGLRLFSVPAALVACPPGYFPHRATDARAALATINDASVVLSILLDGGHSAVAGRLAGAFRNIGRARVADDIIKTMKAAGYAVREKDPFDDVPEILISPREVSPYVNRVQLMWEEMRDTVIEQFPPSPGKVVDIDAYLQAVDDTYVTDAYHSLSIEGYRVSRGLIERVRRGTWSPDADDRDEKNALAARGYWQTYKVVRESVRKVLEGQNPGDAIADGHGDWYRELFAPSVAAGILKASGLAGYRDSQVYIGGSKHVPPRKEAVRDLMPCFFELLRKEKHPAVRVVLGHFVFVYIHPYMDGNGRMGRFLMNVMLAAGGYQWTVLPVNTRDQYMPALEAASVDQDIGPFTDYLGELVKAQLSGHPKAQGPAN